MKKFSTQKQGTRTVQPPDGEVRSSQMITSYGPGSMVDLLNDAVLVGGLDYWGYDSDYRVIDEPRLLRSIRNSNADLTLGEQAFRGPPLGDSKDPQRRVGVKVQLFPQWFVCQNPACRRLTTARHGLERKGNQMLHQCARGKSIATPVRFVEACKLGHLSDFRWLEFVHGMPGVSRCAAAELTFEEGPNGDFQDIRIRCSCGQSRNLITAMSGLKIDCRGKRPWLGPDADEPCKEKIRLLVRTASNSYFAQSMSALSIPEVDEDDDRAPLDRAMDAVWGDLAELEDADVLQGARKFAKSVRDALAGFDNDQIWTAILKRREPKPEVTPHIRSAEYQQFMASKPEQLGELPPANAQFFARRVVPKTPWPQGIGRVVVVPKLREVIAQVGFTRLEPITPDVQGEYDLGVGLAPLGLGVDWLPATELAGEGVLLTLDEDLVSAWENRDEVKARRDELELGFSAWAGTLSAPGEFLGMRYYLLHSLSHLLISAISLECGYAASAIRERIYAGPSMRDPETPMAAILLSTGTSGSEGTLGGLVEQGRNITAHLQRAWDLGKLCSNDPVCGRHSPANDPAERFLEGAACHGCLFIAECSCERFNRFLDRALVVPTLGNPSELAFFGHRP